MWQSERSERLSLHRRRGVYVILLQFVFLNFNTYSCHERHKHGLVSRAIQAVFQFPITTFTGPVLNEHAPDSFKVVPRLCFDYFFPIFHSSILSTAETDFVTHRTVRVMRLNLHIPNQGCQVFTTKLAHIAHRVLRGVPG